MTYYVIDKNGNSYGPATVDVLNQWIQEGRVDSTMIVEEVATRTRRPISSIPNIIFFSTAPPMGQSGAGGQIVQGQIHQGQGQASGFQNPQPGQYGQAAGYQNPQYPQYNMQAQYPRHIHAPIDNHLIKSILATVFCCMPAGIVAIVYSSQVESHSRRGEHDEAVRVAGLADKWGNGSIAVGLVTNILYVGWTIVSMASGFGR